MTSMTAAPPRVFINPGQDRRLARGHPWVYANEIRMDTAAKALPPGTVVQVRRVDGKPLGVGTFNPHALIAFRLFARDPGAAVDAGFFADRLRTALRWRDRLFGAPFYRLLHAEADGVPGLVADRFGDTVVVQAGTAGMEALLPAFLAALDDILAPATVILRNDGAGRTLEGLDSYARIAKGALNGPVEVQEGGLAFLADPLTGQKTGWFFDQRDNRAFVGLLCRNAARVLDVYCYAGGFAVTAAAAGARAVIGIDRSEPALALARQAAERNGVAARCAFRPAEAFATLERLAADGERFDVVIADPPAFAKTKKEVPSGLKGYRKLARLAAAVVAPEGFLFIASCSHNVEAAAFADEVVRGLAAAGRTGRILRAAGAAPDHPVHPHLPETGYLKTLTLQLD
jgi:23S rRNA (cytosine1962-C5)-methyltransferase